MNGHCKLCGIEAILKDSHFIPKFVGKWIKKTSVTGYIREKNEIHKRAQDTYKEYWLCGTCEQLFSGWEREFANRVFYPFVNQGISVAHYNEWMSKFCASISWRTLTYLRSKNPNDELNLERKTLLDGAQSHLKNYLLGNTSNLYQYEQHLFPLERIESANELALPSSINRYFLRTLGMDIVGNSTNQYIFTKIPSFIILGVIKAKNLNKMRSSRVALKSGKVSPQKYVWPDNLATYVFERAEEIITLHKMIPEQHLESFERYIYENPEKVVKSKQFQAFLSDYEMFGCNVFS